MPQFDMENVLFGIDGGQFGIWDGVIAWVMTDLTVVNRWAGEPGWEDIAEKVDEWIEEYGHLVAESVMAELATLAETEGIDGIDVPEVEEGWEYA